MIMKRFILSILLPAAMLAASAAPRVLTLDECRRMALENNMALKNAALRTQAAQETRKEAFTKYFPQVSLAGMAFTTNHGAMQYDFNAAIPLPIPGMSELPISLDFNLLKKGVMAGANLVQPVFLGGMIVNGNRLAEVAEAVAELQSQQSADQVTLTVEQYYWQLAELKAKRATVDELMKLLDTLEHQVQVAVDAGVVLRNDLLQVTLRRNQLESDRITLDSGISVLQTLLGQYVGLGLEPVDIDAQINPAAEVELPDGLLVDPATALSSTIDYQLLQKQVDAADLQKRLTLGLYLPKVAVGAGWFYHDILRQGHSFGALYATVAIPISDWWGGSHALKRAKAQQIIARNEFDDYSQQLQIKMKNCWDQLTAAYRQIGVARESIEQAAENLRLNETFYKAGTTTVDDLLKAQTLFRQANDQYVDALGEYRISTVRYLQATGR